MDGKMGSNAPGHGLSIENAIGSPANLGKENRQPAVLFAQADISLRRCRSAAGSEISVAV